MLNIFHEASVTIEKTALLACNNAVFSCLDLQEILAKLVQMTAGAGMFPGDDTVDQLWIEMDAAARSPTVPGVWDCRCLI